MNDLFIVPVRTPADGVQVIVTGRAPDGRKIGIAFSDPDVLRRALGARAAWIPLSLCALRAMLRPVGVTRIQVDPLVMTARPLAVAG